LNSVDAARFGDPHPPPLCPLRREVEVSPVDAGVLSIELGLLHDVPGDDRQQRDRYQRHDLGPQSAAGSLNRMFRLDDGFEVRESVHAS
jgi:hypothetical protein